MSPELLLRQPYNGKADFWSLGCLIFELLVGHSPFSNGGTIQELVRHVLQRDANFPDTVSANARTCMMALLSREIEARTGSVGDLRPQKFFEGISWDVLGHTPAPWVN